MKVDKITAETAMKSAVAFFATQFDLSELLDRPVSENSLSLTVSAAVEPRGQLAGVVRRADVHVTVGKTPSKSGFFWATLSYRYDHTDGGSNGYDAKFVIVVKRDWDKERVAAVVRREAFDAISDATAEAVRAAIEAKA